MAVDPQEMLDLYMQAERDVLAGKDVTFNGRRMVMADLPQIIKGRQEWEQRVASSRGGCGYAVAVFE
ncbi:primosomal replication protein PriB/PriC domain protein [Pseudomonas mosselii]|uniref:primosomal replication protein PriB/PriC domain protein n=1 Tax=Pseudomonas mosselii TaxID=78327 RepID=UPI0018D76FEC|nr:primosomal replication protein PriB/PriC domain protein [Pseudomonas mosselii]MBH3307966.1 primosomal replication protein PriB/PriC domain protein [Pseudomonas mosselii]MBH3326544.1 primosomal replication protein PriB/PriC domain protein [Pseudomonas mosselii]